MWNENLTVFSKEAVLTEEWNENVLCASMSSVLYFRFLLVFSYLFFSSWEPNISLCLVIRSLQMATEQSFLCIYLWYCNGWAWISYEKQTFYTSLEYSLRDSSNGDGLVWLPWLLQELCLFCTRCSLQGILGCFLQHSHKCTDYQSLPSSHGASVFPRKVLVRISW